jgi:hypothetical protein
VKHRNRWTSAAIAAAALILTAASSTAASSTAAAAPPAPGPATDDGWQMATCVVPEFREVNRDAGVDMLVLTGSATQCRPIVHNAGFRIATYHPGASLGVAESYNIRLFDSLYQGAFPVRDFGTAILPDEPGEYGVCLLAGANERIACRLVTVAAEKPGETKATLAPLPVDAPLVNRGVVAGPYTGEIEPPGDLTGSCGTCF